MTARHWSWEVTSETGTEAPANGLAEQGRWLEVAQGHGAERQPGASIPLPHHLEMSSEKGGGPTLLYAGYWGSRSLGVPTLSRTVLCPNTAVAFPLFGPGCPSRPRCSLRKHLLQVHGDGDSGDRSRCKQPNQKLTMAHEKVPWELLMCSPRPDLGRAPCTPDHRPQGAPVLCLS